MPNSQWVGATARVTLSALQVAGSIIAQQLGLGFVTAVDPTQGQQGVLVAPGALFSPHQTPSPWTRFNVTAPDRAVSILLDAAARLR